MSSLFNQASLVVEPAVYETSKVYATKPFDGSGDLSFSRSNDTATRVGPDGLIEKVRTNLYPRGSALLTTGWTSAGATLTAGQTDPNGGTGALRVQLAAGAANYIQYAESGLSANTPLTRSLYIKAASAQSIKIADPTGTGDKTINLTTSYQRFDLVAPANGSGVYGLYLENADTLAKDFTIAFVQIETGDIATDYIATTSAAVSVGPVANVPRLDYLNSSCPRLLLEPQRTNLATNSETITASTGTTVSLNNAASPDGYVNADKLVEDTSTGFHRTNFNTSLGGSVDSSAYCISIFAKAAGRTRFAFWDNSQDASGYSYFDLSNGTVIVGTGKIENYGNGWYRCTIFPLKNFSTSSSAFINLINTGTNESYTGDGTSGVLFWGKQIEVGAYATSYIPTLGAAVTRGADAASKTGISSLIGQTEGTLFVEFNYFGNIGATLSLEAIPLYVGAGTFADGIYFSVFQTNLYLVVWSGAVNQVTLNLGSISAGKHKVSISYIANDFKVYFNGVLAGTDSSGSIPSLSAVYLGTAGTSTTPEAIAINQALLFKTRLTNAQMQELTSL